MEFSLAAADIVVLKAARYFCLNPGNSQLQ